jgi:hypothetical protein
MGACEQRGTAIAAMSQQQVTRSGRYWGNSGQRSIVTLNGSVANDPSATLAASSGDVVEADFRPVKVRI